MEVRTLLKIRGLSKLFPGVKALDNVDLDVRAGEVHALLGENGAGKSTLLKILSGAQSGDGGTVEFDGKPFEASTPIEATEAGIVTIYQEFSLIPPLSVAENIFLGRQPRGLFGVNFRKMYADAKSALDRIGLNLDPRRLVSSLSVAEQQMTEIARALCMQSKLIIMDEPTAALSGSEVDTLLTIVQELRRQNIAIIYMTHRLPEVFRICDRYTILRDGKSVANGLVSDVDQDALITTMVGRQVDQRSQTRDAAEQSEVALEVKGLNGLQNLRDTNAICVHDASFKTYYGEVLGIAGLVGAGRTETMRMLFGADRRKSGTIHIDGKLVDINSPMDAIRLGIGMVTEDRKAQGCFLDLPVAQNISAASLQQLSNSVGILDLKGETELFHNSRAKVDIKVAGPKQAIGKLSGGNQQKALIARWWSRAPKILIVDEPTRGIDVQAKAQVHQILFELASQGTAVIVISSELPEILTVSDRILTMSEGHITGEFSRKGANEETLMRAMTPSAQETKAI